MLQENNFNSLEVVSKFKMAGFCLKMAVQNAKKNTVNLVKN